MECVVIFIHKSLIYKKRLDFSINDDDTESLCILQETFGSGKILEILGINFHELAIFAFLARINFREFMI